ncbi:MAG: chorismate synthase [Fusobacteriia bacterium 4572_132]|nr:MAG: chorismate synthase [Fusobacteriia bacterium 4572_132]
MLRYLMAGESHGKALTAILEGIPAGLEILEEEINIDLARRQKGYGRGGRMKIETDKTEILNGVRWKKSLGHPITLIIRNKDWENWIEKMDPQGEMTEELKEILITKPRPGHADLTGYLKYNQYDIRNILEYASARNSAIRVAVGGICKKLLKEFGIEIFSYVTEIGGIKADYENMTYEEILNTIDEEKLKTPDKKAEEKMIEKIREAKEKGNTVGGVFEVVATGLPVGLGTYTHWDKRLDGRLAQSFMSIQAIKGVEIGLGFENARRLGSEVHDEIFYDAKKGYYRKENNAGGLEGGMSNGEDIVVKAAMKPIPTLYTPLKSVDVNTKEPFEASVERSDASAVPAASVIGEAVMAYELAKAFLEKFGGDSMTEIRNNYNSYMKHINKK